MKPNIKLLLSAMLVNVGMNLHAQTDSLSGHSELPEFVKVATTDPTKIQMLKSEFKRAPASFQDPMRILMKYPGFSTANDGANGISYRGMPPESFEWQINGVSIVNPNHLSNAGTNDDRATYNAGGTLAMSSAVLGGFSFDAAPSGIQNTVAGGVADVNLSNKINSFYDLSLLGFEGGVNWEKNEKNTYITARNSFVGVLSALGTDFGGERINFADMTLSSELVKTNKSKLTLFVHGGISHNFRDHLADTDSIVSIKDTRDINYSSRHGLVGLDYRNEWKKGYLRSTFVSSGRQDQRDETTFADFIGKYRDYRDTTSFVEMIPLSQHTYSVLETNNGRWRLGLRSTFRMQQFGFRFNSSPEATRFDSKPYVEREFDRFLKVANLQFKGGVGWNMYRKLPDITANIHYKLGTKIHFVVDASHTYPAYFGLIRSPKDFFTTNVELSARYVSETFHFSVKPFYHYWNEALVYFIDDVLDGGKYIHSFNGNVDFRPFYYLPYAADYRTNDAKSLGVEFDINKSFVRAHHSLIFTANLTSYDASYRSNSSSFLPSRYNYGFIGNAGVYFDKTIKGLRRMIIGLTHHTRGGERYQRHDFFSGFIDQQYKNYNRTDARFAYYYPSRRNKNVHRWSLDIQNVTNAQNVGYQFYDEVTKSYKISNQLGFIPVLSYRYEWL